MPSPDADDLEKLAAEVLGNWSYSSSTPFHPANPARVTAPAGSQSLPVAHIGQKVFSFNELTFEPGVFVDVTPSGQTALEAYKAAKSAGGSTQRVIPDRCSYHRLPIKGAPKVPMSAETGERHPDLLERAKQTIRGYACRQRAWPVCGPSNRNVNIDYHFGFDAELGDVLIGLWTCEECK
jgi:hypothetical protein